MVPSFLATAVMTTFLRFSIHAQAICEGSQAWVMMRRDQCRLEHHVPQSAAPTGDGPFPARRSAVMCGRGKSGECGSLVAGDGADLGHFGNQHCAGNRADPRDGTENVGHLRQVIMCRVFAGPTERLVSPPGRYQPAYPSVFASPAACPAPGRRSAQCALSDARSCLRDS